MDRLGFSVVGYGRMGHLVEQVLNERNEYVPSIIDSMIEGLEWSDYSLRDSNAAICFTSPEAGYETTKRILQEGVDAVVGTTRFYLNPDGSENKEMLQEFDGMAKQNDCRMIYASNFSVGMNAFWETLKPLSEIMAKLGYDVAVEERHHNRKADVSGSAKTIGTILLDAYPAKTKLNFGDCEARRPDDEITIVSTRAGSIPGTHTVLFDSEVDSLELTHTVRDPKIFAVGAVDSAYWLKDKEPGLYRITDRL